MTDYRAKNYSNGKQFTGYQLQISDRQYTYRRKCCRVKARPSYAGDMKRPKGQDLDQDKWHHTLMKEEA